MENPFLSFCIPTYNRAQEVYDCVTHILQHPSREIEVVVSNNASEDNTTELLDTIQDPRFRYASNEKNILSVPNFVASVALAKGDFALLFSDEDRIHLDKIDEAIVYLKTVDPDCVAVRFACDGVMLLLGSPFRAEAGPEAFLAAFNSMDVAGTAYNRKVLADVSPEKYIDASHYFFTAFGNIDIILPATVTHPYLFCPIVLINRGDKPELYNELASNVEHDFFIFDPNFTFKLFCDEVSVAEEFYKDSAYEIPICFFFAKLNIIHFTLEYTLPLYTGCVQTIFTPKYGNKKTRERFFSDGKTPIDLARTTTDLCFTYLAEQRRDGIWNSAKYLCDAFFDGQLDTPVAMYTRMEKILIGDLLYTIGMMSDFYQLPIHPSLQFTQTEEIYQLLKQGRLEEVIQYPALDTRRDQFLRGQAYLKKQDWTKAEQCFLLYINSFENAKTLRDIITGANGFVLAHYYLGRIYQIQKKYGKAVKAFSNCYDLVDAYVLESHLTESQIEPYFTG